MILSLLNYISEYQTASITILCLVILLSVIGVEFRVRAAKKAKIARHERRRQKRFQETNDSIRIKVKRAEERREKNLNVPLLDTIIVENLEAAALHRTLSELQKAGKSEYDPSKTVRIYYADKFDPKELGKGKA